MWPATAAGKTLSLIRQRSRETVDALRVLLPPVRVERFSFRLEVTWQRIALRRELHQRHAVPAGCLHASDLGDDDLTDAGIRGKPLSDVSPPCSSADDD